MRKRLKKKLIFKAKQNPVLIMGDIARMASIGTAYKVDYNSFVNAAVNADRLAKRLLSKYQNLTPFMLDVEPSDEASNDDSVLILKGVSIPFTTIPSVVRMKHK